MLSDDRLRRKVRYLGIEGDLKETLIELVERLQLLESSLRNLQLEVERLWWRLRR